jgi:hypothetical protein
MILLSQHDSIKDYLGNSINLYEGLEITVYEPEFDSNGKRDDLIANGYVTKCNKELYKHVKWCCKLDANWIRNESDINELLRPSQLFPNSIRN